MKADKTIRVVKKLLQPLVSRLLASDLSFMDILAAKGEFHIRKFCYAKIGSS